MAEFLSGMIGAAYLIVGLFFLRFWRNTGDRLFAFFAAAFWILALQRVILAFFDTTVENVAYVYLVRLVAFSLILIAIIDKNRKVSSGRQD